MRVLGLCNWLLLLLLCSSTAYAHGGPYWLYTALAVGPYVPALLLAGLVSLLGYNLYRYLKDD